GRRADGGHGDSADAGVRDRDPGRRPRPGRGHRPGAVPDPASRRVLPAQKPQAAGNAVSGAEAVRGQERLIEAGARRARARLLRRHLLVYAGLVPFILIAVFPVFWMAVTAFKTDNDLVNPTVFPFRLNQEDPNAFFRHRFQYIENG